MEFILLYTPQILDNLDSQSADFPPHIGYPILFSWKRNLLHMLKLMSTSLLGHIFKCVSVKWKGKHFTLSLSIFTLVDKKFINKLFFSYAMKSKSFRYSWGSRLQPIRYLDCWISVIHTHGQRGWGWYAGVYSSSCQWQGGGLENVSFLPKSQENVS